MRGRLVTKWGQRLRVAVAGVGAGEMTVMTVIAGQVMYM